MGRGRDLAKDLRGAGKTFEIEVALWMPECESDLEGEATNLFGRNDGDGGFGSDGGVGLALLFAFN
jgi:hypothetical protein